MVPGKYGLVPSNAPRIARRASSAISGKSRPRPPLRSATPVDSFSIAPPFNTGCGVHATVRGGAMAYEFIRYEKKDRIATITINRPDVMNALHPPANLELSAA